MACVLHARPFMSLPASFETSRWLRAGLLVLPLLMGAALVGSAVSDRRRTYEASELLVRGQADWFLRSLAQSFRDAEGPPDAAELAALHEELASDGLRYLALLRPDGSVGVEAGAPLAGSAAGVRGPAADSLLRLERAGSRVRVTAEPPLRRLRRPARPGWATRARAPRGRLVLAMEFEPTVADRLRHDADRAFALSVATAGLLMLVAGALWYQLRRREQQARALEREHRLAQLGEMSAVLAHEMRNPLASLKGHAQLLLEKLPHETREAKKAERIVLEATRLESLSHTLLDFVRSAEVERTPTEIVPLIEQAADQVAKGRVRIALPSAPLRPVAIDPLRMQQVLVNLLENAIQFSPEEREVVVVVSQTTRSLTLEVRDHGPGLPAGEEQQIFEAFYTTKTQGTGLGLAIARRIVELHRGRLSARNHPDGGAVFALELPM